MNSSTFIEKDESANERFLDYENRSEIEVDHVSDKQAMIHSPKIPSQLADSTNSSRLHDSHRLGNDRLI